MADLVERPNFDVDGAGSAPPGPPPSHPRSGGSVRLVPAPRYGQGPDYAFEHARTDRGGERADSRLRSRAPSTLAVRSALDLRDDFFRCRRDRGVLVSTSVPIRPARPLPPLKRFCPSAHFFGEPPGGSCGGLGVCPPITASANRSRPIGVRRAFLRMFIRSLRENTEASQPQLPRSGPVGQPAESSQLERKLEPAFRFNRAQRLACEPVDQSFREVIMLRDDDAIPVTGHGSPAVVCRSQGRSRRSSLRSPAVLIRCADGLAARWCKPSNVVAADRRDGRSTACAARRQPRRARSRPRRRHWTFRITPCAEGAQAAAARRRPRAMRAIACWRSSWRVTTTRACADRPHPRLSGGNRVDAAVAGQWPCRSCGDGPPVGCATASPRCARCSIS